MIAPDFAWAALIFGGTLFLIVYALGCIAFLFRLIDAAEAEPITPDDPEEAARCAERYTFLKTQGPKCRPPIGIYYMQDGMILVGKHADQAIDDAIRAGRKS